MIIEGIDPPLIANNRHYCSQQTLPAIHKSRTKRSQANTFSRRRPVHRKVDSFGQAQLSCSEHGQLFEQNDQMPSKVICSSSAPLCFEPEVCELLEGARIVSYSIMSTQSQSVSANSSKYHSLAEMSRRPSSRRRSLADLIKCHGFSRLRSSLLLVIFSAVLVPVSVSGHSMVLSSLHRHHHPSHPHAQNAQYHRSTGSGSGSFVSAQTYANQARYGIQADQASIVGMRHTLPPTVTLTTTPTALLPSPTRRPSTSDRSVRRVDPRAHPNHLGEYFARRQQQQQQQLLHRPTTTTTTSSTTTTTTVRPSVARAPFNHCPPGPPTSWKGKLDVAAKAYLAPVVLYGQLISLSEDYGGRIAATFRLLKTVKPEMSVLNHSEIAEKLNDSRFEETHVKLYFVRNSSETETNQPPFCAHAMPRVFQELKTAERYILFTYPQVLSSRGYTLPVNKNGNVRSHQIISLVTFAPPEVHSRNSSRMVRKVLCQHCAKPATVHSSARIIHVPSRGTISLVCRSTGNPTPWIEWYRNGKRLASRKRVNIITKRRVSHLTIRRSSFKRDQGYYECRAMNVVSSEPAVRRFQVIVDRPQEVRHHSKPARPFRPITSSPTSSLYNINRNQVTVNDAVESSDRNKNAVSESSTTSPTLSSSSESSAELSVSDRPKSLWFQAKPCPMSSYCLNGGTCSLYEAVGEYVCQCAEGYRGQRCEFKDIFNYPAQKALLDYDLNTRMVHSYMINKTNG